MQPQEGVAETDTVFGTEEMEMLRYLVKNCLTKDDLKSAFVVSEHRMMTTNR